MDKLAKRSRRQQFKAAAPAGAVLQKDTVASMFTDDMMEAFGVDADAAATIKDARTEEALAPAMDDGRRRSSFATPARKVRNVAGGTVGASPSGASPETASQEFAQRSNAGKVELEFDPSKVPAHPGGRPAGDGSLTSPHSWGPAPRAWRGYRSSTS